MPKWMLKSYQLPISFVVVVIGLCFWLPKIWTKDTSLVAQFTAQEFYEAIGGGVALLAALQWFLTTLIEARMKYEYDLKIEDYKRDLQIRDQAAKVAEFLAFVQWHQTDMKGEDFDKRAWELSLWLPTEIYVEVAKCLVGTPDAIHMKQILIDVRKHLLKDKAGALVADNILHFVRPEQAR